MDTALLHFRSATLRIGKSLDREQLSDLKFLCKDVPGFTQHDMDTILDGASLITKLEQLDVLSQQNVDYVATLLGLVNRADLEQVLRQYEVTFLGKPVGHGVGGGPGPIAQPMSANFPRQNPQSFPSTARYNSQNQPVMGEDLMEEFDIIVENIGRDWRQLARRLGLSEVDIECITENHSRNLREQSRQALWSWKNTQRQAATRAALVQALRKCRMNYIADIIEGYIER